MTDDLESTTATAGSDKQRSERTRRWRGRRSADAKRQRTGDAEPATKDEKPQKKGAFFREMSVLVVLVLVLTALLRGFVFEAYMIPSGSMENTLRIGDKVLVNKLVYRFRPVERGDVIVFDGAGSFTPEVRSVQPSNPVKRVAEKVWQFFGGAPADEEDFVKRVVGVPGDRVECRKGTDGFAMYVNGVRLDERPYLYRGDQPCSREFGGSDAVVVPKGRLWVMGDHRSLSADSREHVDDGHFGTVPEKAVIGRAVAIVWPTGHWRSLTQPATFRQRALHGAAPAPGHPAAPHPLGASLAAVAVVGAGVGGRRRRT
ncbi:MAG: signal peptidase I [Streptosporangiales bacterium]|nr:signal peptidase I [Streptosporangiales bacterium]MBO0892198.1 signal peptidase I [Acidothermales bacterium]